jgi:hypothetical protein
MDDLSLQDEFVTLLVIIRVSRSFLLHLKQIIMPQLVSSYYLVVHTIYFSFESGLV